MRCGYEVFHADVATLVEFYVRVLGFEAQPSWDEACYVAVVRGDVVVGCCTLDGAQADPPGRRPPVGSEIVLRVDDVHAEYARVVGSEWPVADALAEQPWGQTDFRLFDPSGQYLRVTSSREVSEKRCWGGHSAANRSI